MSAVIRRQEHGIKAISLSVTLPGNEMARLRREARQQGITVSRHIVNLIRLAWSVQGALAPLAPVATPNPAPDPDTATPAPLALVG